MEHCVVLYKINYKSSINVNFMYLFRCVCVCVYISDWNNGYARISVQDMASKRVSMESGGGSHGRGQRTGE